jgi:predicted Zn-dependent protease
MKSRLIRYFVLFFAVTCLITPGFTANKQKNSNVDDIGNRNINKGNILPTMSLEKEIALGRQLADQVERQSKLVTDPVINEYVNRIEQNIVRNSDAKVPFSTKIIDSDEVNAFALPGGFLFVNSGLILAADDEAELAGVLAHETAHVAARHGAETASKQTAFNLASIPLIFLGGAVGYGARQAAGLAIPLQFLKFSRNQEAEADYLGAQYMYKTGYDPSAMLSFFEKLQAKEKARPGTMNSLFTDHPPTPDRIAAVKKEIETILPPRDQYAVTSSEFDTIKSRLTALGNHQPVENDKQSQPAPAVDDRPPLKRKN